MKNHIENVARNVNWQPLPDAANWVVEQAMAIQQIPAPTFDELQRATYVQEQFLALGLQDVEMDSLYNVYGRLAGERHDQPALMLMAHTDTVFPRETALETRQENGGVIYGPGLGDNSMGVGGLLGFAHLLRCAEVTPAVDIWCVATTREEGLGDLGGVKAAFKRLQPRVGAVINIEGLAYGHIYHAGIAVKRLHITAKTDGGHSWLHFGKASAVHGIVQLGAAITSLNVPQSPRTTYNIGLIDGGQSINSIASSASLWLDLRSEDKASLDLLEQTVRARVAALTTPELTFTIEIVGERPAGRLEPEHPLVQGALAALAHLGLSGSLETGSTDGNVPLAAGIPTVTIGITRGGNAHRTDEYIETEPVRFGLKQLVILGLAAAEAQIR